jgi:flagellar hook-length control protein FliK
MNSQRDKRYASVKPILNGAHMNNPAIIISAIAAPTMAPPVKQSESPQPETSFNQVLQREISDRGNADNANADKPQEPSSANAAPAASAKPAEKADGKEKTSDTDEDQKTDTTDAAASASTPADMLALFANVGQIAIAPEPRSEEAAGVSLKGVKPGADLKLAGIDATPTDVTKKADKPTGKVDGAVQTFDAKLAVASDKPAEQTDAKDLTDSAQSGNKKPKELATPDARVAPVADSASDAKPAPERVVAMPASASRSDASTAVAAADTKAIPALLDTQPAPTAMAVAQGQQVAAMSGMQAMATQGTNQLTPRVGAPGWDQALSQKVVWMVAGDQQNASITLNPPDLGPLQVVLNVTNSQATVTFSAAQPEVRQALEAAIPKLREMMGDAGIQLGQATVGTGTPQQNDNSGERSQSGRFNDPVGAVAETSVQVPRTRAISSGQGMVDTFV